MAMLDAILAKVRRERVGALEESDMLTLHRHLLTQQHWFCPDATESTRGAATTFLRISAYPETDLKTQWITQFNSVMNKCIPCIEGLSEAKKTAGETYFSIYPPDSLEMLWTDFDRQEVLWVLQSFPKQAEDSDTSSSVIWKEPALVFRILSNLQTFQDHQILSLFRRQPPSEASRDWPKSRFPAGLLLLLFHELPDVSSWAILQTKKCDAPLTEDAFLDGHGVQIISAVVSQIGNKGLLDRDLSWFPFSKVPSVLWAGLYSALVLSPNKCTSIDSKKSMDIRSLVLGHLPDVGMHFPFLLNCFQLLLVRLKTDFWKGYDSKYPFVVFASVKDNHSFLDMVQSSHEGKCRRHLEWFQSFLYSVRKLPVFDELIPQLADFLFEELQHVRFGDERHFVTSSASKLFSNALTWRGESTDIIGAAVDIHSEIVGNIAFGDDYSSSLWRDSRLSTRGLLKAIMLSDVTAMLVTIDKLSKAANISSSHKPTATQSAELKQLHQSLSTANFKPGIWEKALQSLPDSDAISMAVHVISKIAHVDPLNKQAYLPTAKNSKQKELETTPCTTAFDKVNALLNLVHETFKSAVTNYVDFKTDVSQIFEDRVQDVAVLLLSPVECIQESGQKLVRLQYDVDERDECFRALLSNHPQPTLDGLFSFLKCFNGFIETLPEACRLSRATATHFTDILEVLCNRDAGLLSDQIFLKRVDGETPQTRLQHLWALMGQTIARILQRTRGWVDYNDRDVMVEWMRDALIFGRDLLKSFPAFEKAVNANETSSKSRSKVAKRMLQDLQDIYTGLADWLLLTDQETLYQGFSLLKSMLSCFRDHALKPSEEGLVKLKRRLTSAQSNDSKQLRTHLDPPRVKELAEALSWFDDDDEVEIISYKPASSKTDTMKKVPQARKSLEQAKTKQIPKPSQPLHPTRTLSSLPLKKTSTSLREQSNEAKPLLPAFKRSNEAAKGTRHDVSSSRGSQSTSKAATPPELSSGSETTSSSDDDGEPSGLAALAKHQKSPPKIKKAPERRAVKVMDIATSASSIRERSNRRAPIPIRGPWTIPPTNFSELYRELLSWDYDNTGPDPANIRSRFQPLADTFEDYSQYKKALLPLLFHECWSQLMASKDEELQSVVCSINSRSYVDNWVDIEITVKGALPEKWFLADTDVVLLKYAGTDGYSSVLAKVQESRSSRMSGESSLSATLRYMVPQGRIPPNLIAGVDCSLTKVYSLSTIHREFSALQTLVHYGILRDVLSANLPPKPKIDATHIKDLMNRYSVNEPQATAISGALQTQGFVLIQGPPGTGKTSTICGLVSAALSSHRPSNGSSPKKILVCAPSNAAIDEVCQRLASLLGRGEKNEAKVVRTGAEGAVGDSVKQFTLDALVDQRLDPVNGGVAGDARAQLQALREQLHGVKETITIKRKELEDTQGNNAQITHIQDEIRRLAQQRDALGQKINIAKDQGEGQKRTADASRRRERRTVLNNALVICCTLSGSGHDSLTDLAESFDTVIIDEAAQAIELSSLIPLRFLCKRCVMVGDPQQLAPTVISKKAAQARYDQSLFVRLYKQREDSTYLLSIQYRMHPEISYLPSRLFYSGRLLDGPNMDEKTKQAWHGHPLFGVYRFYDASDGREEQATHSLKNMLEVQIAINLFDRLRREYKSFDFEHRIGIVTPYKAQRIELKRAFERRFGKDTARSIHFNTIDGFQGQEKDVILLSCVRAGTSSTNIGFLSDVRRMNVALTRAKSSLFIIGHAATLARSDPMWNNILSDAKERSVLLEKANSGMFMASNIRFATAESETIKTGIKRKKTSVAVVPEVPPDLATPLELGRSMSSHKNGPSGRTLSLIALASIDGAHLSSTSEEHTNAASAVGIGVSERPAKRPRRSHETSEAAPVQASPPLQLAVDDNSHPEITPTPSSIKPVRAPSVPSGTNDSVMNSNTNGKDPLSNNPANHAASKMNPPVKRKKEAASMFIPKKRK